MPASPSRSSNQRSNDDGTRQLLQWGGSMVALGILSVLLLEFAFGGYSRNGASTNSGWFVLIVALMCLPFGAMLLALGVAKWFKNRQEKSRS
jgi:Na+/melibiose symporter-like transporter